MSEAENFFARWARLKQESGVAARASAVHPSTDIASEEEGGPPSPPVREPAAGQSSPVGLSVPGQSPQAGQSARTGESPPMDQLSPGAVNPASLPCIESIATETDIRPFLQAGVPAELARSALRAAWAVDPAIRDFIGIAETQWDFNDPTAMEGFGPLQSTDVAASLLARVMSKPPAAPESAAPELAAAERPAVEALGAVRDRRVDAVWLSSSMAQETAPTIEMDLGERDGEGPEPDGGSPEPNGGSPELGGATSQEAGYASLPFEKRPVTRRHGGALPKAPR